VKRTYVKPTYLLTAVVAAALVTGGCEGRLPTAPDRMPAVSASATAPPSTHGGSATTEFVEFTFNPTINVPAPCLGVGLFVITGTVQGWARITTAPNGQVHLVERWDFSQLTATFGTDTWRAAPGSGEMFQFNNLPGVGGTGAPVAGVVHQGRTRFIADGDAPDVFFVHRFRILRLPNGEFQFTRMETEIAEIACIGPNP
jgi:hypothetical protein